MARLLDHSGESALLAFQRILALVIATEYWTKTLRDWALLDAADVTALPLATILSAAVFFQPTRRAAFAGLALLQLWWIARYFPLAGNHRYLEMIFALFFCLLDSRRAEDRGLQLRAVRTMVVVVLFYAGLQKFAWGYWSDAELLTLLMKREPFASMLAPFEGTPLILLSNFVWFSEIGLASLLLFPRTRRFAWPAAIAMVVAVEVVARELMFGVEFCAALTLFAARDMLSRWVIPAGLFLASLLLMRLGLLPEILFH